MEAFPDAKIILTVRDPEKWYESVKNSIFKAKDIYQTFPMNLMLWFGNRYNTMKVVSDISTKPIQKRPKGNTLRKRLRTGDRIRN